MAIPFLVRESTVPDVVYKRVVADFGATDPVSRSVVPYTELVHDRLSIEVLRGCARGCRFCQAGITYRPVRERTPIQIVAAVSRGLKEQVTMRSRSPRFRLPTIPAVRRFSSA